MWSAVCAHARAQWVRVSRVLRPVPRVPTVLQMEAVECGAAALAMILAYHGRVVPLEELRIECGVSRDGSKASNMLTAARRFGMEAKGYRTEPEQLLAMDLPAIVHWNFNHFVVVEGARVGWVQINDPARGPARVTASEFDEAFTGVALTFCPTPSFERGGHTVGWLASLRPRLTGSGMGLMYIVFAGLGLVLPGIFVPTLQRVFVDDVLIRGLIALVASAADHPVSHRGRADDVDVAATTLSDAAGNKARDPNVKSVRLARTASADAVLYATSRWRPYQPRGD